MAQERPSGQLARTLGLGSAIMLVVGNVVGAGIFATSGLVAAETTGAPSFFIAWALGGALSLLGALTYAELGAMFPKAGGDYQYLKEAYGPLAGFALGWLYFWIISPGSIAALALLLVDQLPLVDALGSSQLARTALALLAIATLSALNARGTVLASRTQTAVTATSLVLLCGLVVVGALLGHGSTGNFSTGTHDLHLTGAAMTAVFFTYAGWFAASYVGSEVKRPERNVPWALILGTLLITALYLSVNAIYVYAVPLSEMAGRTDVARLAATVLFGPQVGALVTLAVALCVTGCLNATILTGARVSYAMAIDRVFFASLGHIHPRWATPHVAVLAQAILASGLVIIGTLAQGAIDGLLSYVVFAMLLASASVGVAHMLLRWRKPELPRPYRTALGPVIPLVFSVAYLGFALAMIASRPIPSLIGLIITASSAPFFYLWKRPRGSV